MKGTTKFIINKICSFNVLILTGFLFFGNFVFSYSDCWAQDTPKQYIKVAKIENNQVILDVYQTNGNQKIDISDLILSDKYTKGNSLPSELNFIWQSVPDVKLLLLQNGSAQLKNFESAEDKYKNAQRQAEKNNLGVWYKPTPTPSPTPTVTTNTNTSKVLGEEAPSNQTSNMEPSISPSVPIQKPDEPSFFTYIWQQVTDNWFWFMNLGIVSVLVTFIVAFGQAKYRERKIKLIIIGEPSSGKTALYCRIQDEDISKEDILKLTPTKAVVKYPMTRPIAHGRLDIYLRLTDIPGNSYSTIWDELLKNRFTRSPALLVVLAPTINQIKQVDKVIDDNYIAMQLGFLQGYIVGGMGTKKTKKPKAVIFFLNKFDLFSSQPPDSNEGRKAEKEFREIFEEHINICLESLKSANIPNMFIVGSALEKWSCDQIMKNINKLVYGK